MQRRRIYQKDVPVFASISAPREVRGENAVLFSSRRPLLTVRPPSHSKSPQGREWEHWEMMVEDTAHSLQPTGLALAIFVVSLILLVLSASAVGLRAYFKYIDHIFGVDDALIVAGLVCNPPFPRNRGIVLCHGFPIAVTLSLHSPDHLYRRRRFSLSWGQGGTRNPRQGLEHVDISRGQEVLDVVDDGLHRGAGHHQELHLCNPLSQCVSISWLVGSFCGPHADEAL